MDVLLYSLGAVALAGGVLLGASARVVQQIERGVVFRLGRAQTQPRPAEIASVSGPMSLPWSG